MIRIKLDFWSIDSWDNEKFLVYVGDDDQLVY